jgi:hypothetical protein
MEETFHRRINLMIIAGEYSFNGGKELINNKYRPLLKEIVEIIAGIDANKHKTKISKEKTMRDKVLFNPRSLNDEFKSAFYKRNWKSIKVKCEYPTKYYTKNYQPKGLRPGAIRQICFYGL